MTDSQAAESRAAKKRRSEATRRSRARTGNARGKRLDRARAKAMRALIAAHSSEWKALYAAAKAKEGL